MNFFSRFPIGIGLTLLMIQHFDFLREPHSAVPLYADECGSPGLVAFSTVRYLIFSHLSNMASHSSEERPPEMIR